MLYGRGAGGPALAEPRAPGLRLPPCMALRRLAGREPESRAAGKVDALFSAFDKALDGCEVLGVGSFFFFLNLNDLEALTTCIRKVDFKPTLLFINEIKECGLNCILGSSFSTFGIVRCSLAFLKT